jgi:hypothetical protein
MITLYFPKRTNGDDTFTRTLMKLLAPSLKKTPAKGSID